MQTLKPWGRGAEIVGAVQARTRGARCPCNAAEAECAGSAATALGSVPPLLGLQICFGWGVGISRIIDNKHSTADVVGGFLLGAMIGLAFVMKVPPHHNTASGHS